MVQDSEKRAELLQQTEDEINALDLRIYNHVTDGVLPQILPEDCIGKEKDTISRMVNAVVALDVYHKEILRMYDKFQRLAPMREKNYHYVEMTSASILKEMGWMLRNTEPISFSLANKVSAENLSRYAGRYKNDSLDEKKRMVLVQRRGMEREIVKLQERVSMKQFEHVMESYPQAERIIEIRNILYNGGKMERNRLTEPFLKHLEETVETLKGILQAKTFRYHLLAEEPDVNSRVTAFFQPRDLAEAERIYQEGAHDAGVFIGMYNLYQNVNLTQTLMQETKEAVGQKWQEKRTEMARKKLIKNIESSFPYFFRDLPSNLSKQKVAVKELIRSTGEDAAHIVDSEAFPGLMEEIESKVNECYENRKRKQDAGELPDSLSNSEEAKKRELQKGAIDFGIAAGGLVAAIAASYVIFSSQQASNPEMEAEKAKSPGNQQVEKTKEEERRGIYDTFDQNGMIEILRDSDVVNGIYYTLYETTEKSTQTLDGIHQRRRRRQEPSMTPETSVAQEDSTTPQRRYRRPQYHPENNSEER